MKDNFKKTLKIFGGISGILTVIFFIIQLFIANYYGNKPVPIDEVSISKIENIIKKYQPQDIPESEKEEVRTAAEKITNPKTAYDYILKGYVDLIDKNHEKAIEYYQKAIELK